MELACFYYIYFEVVFVLLGAVIAILKWNKSFHFIFYLIMVFIEDSIIYFFTSLIYRIFLLLLIA
jgi:hypothetical protein